MSDPLRISVHATERYCERFLRWPKGKVSAEDFSAAEGEIAFLCRRASGLGLPRFVVRFHHFSFVVVGGTVVTVLDPTQRAWMGKFHPNQQTEVVLND